MPDRESRTGERLDADWCINILLIQQQAIRPPPPVSTSEHQYQPRVSHSKRSGFKSEGRWRDRIEIETNLPRARQHPPLVPHHRSQVLRDWLEQMLALTPVSYRMDGLGSLGHPRRSPILSPRHELLIVVGRCSTPFSQVHICVLRFAVSSPCPSSFYSIISHLIANYSDPLSKSTNEGHLARSPPSSPFYHPSSKSPTTPSSSVTPRFGQGYAKGSVHSAFSNSHSHGLPLRRI